MARRQANPERKAFRSAYPGMPIAVLDEPPQQRIYAPKEGHPWYTAITELMEQTDQIRNALGREINKWQKWQQEALERGDTHVYERARNELSGLWGTLARLDRI